MDLLLFEGVLEIRPEEVCPFPARIASYLVNITFPCRRLFTFRPIANRRFEVAKPSPDRRSRFVRERPGPVACRAAKSRVGTDPNDRKSGTQAKGQKDISTNLTPLSTETGVLLGRLFGRASTQHRAGFRFARGNGSERKLIVATTPAPAKTGVMQKLHAIIDKIITDVPLFIPAHIVTSERRSDEWNAPPRCGHGTQFHLRRTAGREPCAGR